MPSFWAIIALMLIVLTVDEFPDEIQLFSSTGGVCERDGVNRTTFEYARRLGRSNFKSWTVCYFVVEDAIDRAKTFKSILRWWDQREKFSISTARQICARYGATLPLLKTKLEEKHLLNNYYVPNIDAIALDLTWDSNAGYLWVDGTPLGNVSEKHVTLGPGQEFAYTAVRKDGEEIVWYDQSASDTRGNGTAVVCRQEFKNSFMRTLYGVVTVAIWKIAAPVISLIASVVILALVFAFSVISAIVALASIVINAIIARLPVLAVVVFVAYAVKQLI